MPWRCGVVVIVSTKGKADGGFESRQGVWLLGLYTFAKAVLCSLVRIVIVRMSEINVEKKYILKTFLESLTNI
jgi:hypothetical protein